MKNKYENTKPIRGRAVEVRPWNKRSRGWEQVVQYRRAIDGATMYGAKLFDTNVISVAPNGDIHFDSGGWLTPTTAQFMSQVMRESAGWYYSIGKQFNALWVFNKSDSKTRKIPDKGGITLTYDPATDKYDAPLSTVVKKSVNRTAIKEVRNSLNKFKQFYKMFLKMSDGLISADTIAQYAVAEDGEDNYKARVTGISVPRKEGGDTLLSKDYWWRVNIPKRISLKVLEIAQSDDESAYLPLLCFLSISSSGSYSAHRAEVGLARMVTTSNGVSINSIDMFLAHKDVDDRLDKLIKDYLDVWAYTTITVTTPTKDETPKALVLT